MAGVVVRNDGQWWCLLRKEWMMYQRVMKCLLWFCRKKFLSIVMWVVWVVSSVCTFGCGSLSLISPKPVGVFRCL